MEPLISVIVPVYNVEFYLRKCVDSILNQTYRNLEVILVDDGSPDGCPAICDEYAAKDDRVKVIHKINEGQAIARNTALEIVSGEYVAFVDSDDWIDFRLYETVMQYAPFDVALFGCTYIDAQTGKTVVNTACDDTAIHYWSANTALTERLIRNSLFGYACNKVYSKAVITDLIYPNVLLREDLVFNIAVYSRTDRITLVNCEGYYYLQHENSNTKKSYSGRVPDIAVAAQQMTMIHPHLPEEVNRKLADLLIKQYLCDAMYKYIFMNHALTEQEVIGALRDIFANRCLAKMMRFLPGDGGLFKLLTVCLRLKAAMLFYQLLRRQWRE